MPPRSGVGIVLTRQPGHGRGIGLEKRPAGRSFGRASGFESAMDRASLAGSRRIGVVRVLGQHAVSIRALRSAGLLYA